MESLKGKLTEEEAFELYNNTIPEGSMLCSSMIADKCVDIAKQKGYIKQNSVEKAEKRLIQLSKEIKECCIHDQNFYKSDCELFHEAIQYLKKQLEE